MLETSLFGPGTTIASAATLLVSLPATPSSGIWEDEL